MSFTRSKKQHPSFRAQRLKITRTTAEGKEECIVKRQKSSPKPLSIETMSDGDRSEAISEPSTAAIPDRSVSLSKANLPAMPLNDWSIGTESMEVSAREGENEPNAWTVGICLFSRKPHSFTFDPNDFDEPKVPNDNPDEKEEIIRPIPGLR
jgi:hypothetical protein